jgi:hypothetical protein
VQPIIAAIRAWRSIFIGWNVGVRARDAFCLRRAQDFDKGVAAYQAGDFATALQEFLPLAEGRNSPSRLSLADRIANS